MHVAYSDEWPIILGFVGAFVALYAAAGFLLLRQLFSHEERKPPFGFTGKVVLFLALAGIIAGAYSMFVEPYSLEVTHVEIPIKGLTSKIRIAQISDLHSDGQERLEGKIAPEIRKEHPDLIFYTGDSINSLRGFKNFYRCIKSVEEIAPLISIKGDWDFDPDLESPVERAGLIKAGEGPAREFTIRGAKICVLCVSSGESAIETLKLAPKNMPLIVLTHGPDSDAVQDYKTRGIDLICCGHTHGGQIALPFYGALITQSKTKRQFASGLHKILDTWIYTNRGIGMEGHFPRVRFCAKPEITIFDLVPGGPRPPVKGRD